MTGFTGFEITKKRKMMRLSQRKAASMIEKIYGVKLSHSYLSLIESGQVNSVGANLENALEDFFELKAASSPGKDKAKTRDTADTQVQRIPLYRSGRVEGHLDIAGPVLADFAVEISDDIPDMGIFRGDVLICRKDKPSPGDMVITQKPSGLAYNYYESPETADVMGTIVLIIKKSLTYEHHQASIKAAAAKLGEDLLIGELARRKGIRSVDLIRSIAVLKEFFEDYRTGDISHENKHKRKDPEG